MIGILCFAYNELCARIWGRGMQGNEEILKTYSVPFVALEGVSFWEDEIHYNTHMKYIIQYIHGLHHTGEGTAQVAHAHACSVTASACT